MILSKIRKKHSLYDLRKEAAKWIEKDLGPEYVNEFLEKYDALNGGVPIGGFLETAIFVNMIEKIKQEIEMGQDTETEVKKE